MKHYTNQHKINGEMACRSLSPKAYEVYLNTDPLTVYAYETEEGTRYDVDGCMTASNLTFAELNEFFEGMSDAWDEVYAE